MTDDIPTEQFAEDEGGYEMATLSGDAGAPSTEKHVEEVKEQASTSALPIARLWQELGNPAAGKPKSINREQVIRLLGVNWAQLLLEMQKAGQIELGLDSKAHFELDHHPMILAITFQSAGLNCIEEHRKRLEDETAKAKQSRIEAAETEVRKLIEAEQITPNKKTLDVTGARLETILGPDWPAGLERMDEAGYLAWKERPDEPGAYTVTFTTKTLELAKTIQTPLKPGPKTHARQVTVDGKEVDLRNRSSFNILNADIADLQNVTRSLLHQFRSDPTKRQRRRLRIELQNVVALRGRDLSGTPVGRYLYGSICLRLGMELPKDFWYVPAEMLGKETAINAE